MILRQNIAFYLNQIHVFKAYSPFYQNPLNVSLIRYIGVIEIDATFLFKQNTMVATHMNKFQ